MHATYVASPGPTVQAYNVAVIVVVKVIVVP